jgi:tetratricopeptide (TPR) repeat protein
MRRAIALSAFLTAVFASPAIAQSIVDQRATCESRDQTSSPDDRDAACTMVLAGGGLSPHSEAMALVNRAWARSLEGEMSGALADEDRAVALEPSSSVPLNERALLRLRAGKVAAALADYDRALKLSPNASYSLYGRGLARLRAGDEANGEADLAAARRIDPSVDAVFRGIGMTR